eukprot:jgi/Botrbrau1/3060/Bobra.0070s0053.1
MPNATPDQAIIKVTNARGLVAVLQTMKSTNKLQQCIMSIESEGVRIRWEGRLQESSVIRLPSSRSR